MVFGYKIQQATSHSPCIIISLLPTNSLLLLPFFSISRMKRLREIASNIGKKDQTWQYVTGGKSEEGDMLKLESLEEVEVSEGLVNIVGAADKAVGELKDLISKSAEENQILERKVKKLRREDEILKLFVRKSDLLAVKSKFFEHVMSGESREGEFGGDDESLELDLELEIQRLKMKIAGEDSI